MGLVAMIFHVFTVLLYGLTVSSGDEISKRLIDTSTTWQASIKGYVGAPVSEASGLAASRKYPGFLYTHNDHGGKNEVYVLTTTGTLYATLKIIGATNYDWEDIAIGPCDSNNSTNDCLYIADIGMGTGSHGAVNIIYKVQEPDVLQSQDVPVKSILKFDWDEPDSETIMVDPMANVYIISKASGARGIIVMLPNSAWGSAYRVDLSSTAIVGIHTTHHDPLGGDISLDGEKVIVKAREHIYYWEMRGSPDYMAVLAKPGIQIPYTMERIGQALCWDAAGKGYYTLGEGDNQPLYYYAVVAP